MTRDVLIMAGGTGGHVFPALAVAHELAERGYQVQWLGAPGGIEKQLVPRAGYPLHVLPVRGVRRGGLARVVSAPWMLAGAVIRAWRLVRVLRPVVALGFGGFASGPGGIGARLAGVPLVLHEQNARPGLTNRWLARVSARVLQGFPGAFGERSGVETVGNPVRAEIAALAEPGQRYGRRSGPLRILITGGSQGALALNHTLPRCLAAVLGPDLTIVHQAGRGRSDEARGAWQEAGVEARVVDFIEDMAGELAQADLLVCRAGALSVWEAAVAGVAALFVPLPTAVDDHQTRNARWLADQGAAALLPQDRLDEEGLSEALADLRERADLQAVAEKARALAPTDSAARVARVCEEVVHG